jgi:hypothetical protein
MLPQAPPEASSERQPVTTAAAEELEARRRQAGLSLTGLNEQLRRPQRREEDVTHDRVRKEHRRRI